MGEEETISIEHTAMNRRVFARGALRATEWILGKPAGLYHMDDML
jgi:4-hydroxy-tetrahydrodipicolinate reductase